MSQKLVSIIIPAWQSAGTLPTTLRTIFAQTYRPLEVIIVDDASTDATEAAIAPWRDRIHYEKLSANAGAPHARNTGFGFASGEFVMFCDSDLVLRADAIEKLVQTLEAHPEASYAYGSFRFGWKKFKGGIFDAAKLRARNFIHTSALIRGSAAPHFDESLKRFQDWDLWLTFLEQGKVGVWFPEVLFQAIPRGAIGISNWRPSFWYKVPWERFGYVPKSVSKYRAAASIIKQKHQL
jgi:glycosyltransferase involved in cell wall biosynthesis